MDKKLVIGKLLAMVLVVSLVVSLTLASAPGVAAKKDRPDRPEHPEHPDHPEHPEHPEHPAQDGDEGEDDAPDDADGGEDSGSDDVDDDYASEAGDSVSYGINEGSNVAISDYGVGATQAGSSSGGYSVPLSYMISSEAPQLVFFMVSSISVLISCVSLVSIFGRRPVPFVTVKQLRDAIFHKSTPPRFGGSYKIR